MPLAFNLSDTKVTDAGLEELAALKKLRTLRLYKTRLTVAAINELQKVLPHCRIEITAAGSQRGRIYFPAVNK
jgi:hypothetical protein